MSALLQLAVLPGETLGFFWSDGRLAGLAVERATGGLRAGDRLVGRVATLDRRLQAAFVALPEGPDGLLPLNAVRGLSEGQAIAVRITRAASEGKGPKLVADGAAPGPGVVPRILARGAGALEPLLALATTVESDDPLAARAAQERGLTGRFLPGGFAPEAQARQDEALEQLLQPAVALPGGGTLLIEPTRTLTAIDVNLAQAGGVGAGAAQAVNQAAAQALPRQLGLRALGGRILVDFLESASSAQRALVETALKQAFATLPLRVKFIGWSRGGLYELTLQRTGPALHETLLEPAAYGGWRKRPLTLAFEALRALDRAQRAQPTAVLRLALRPDLLPLLREHPALLALQERFGRPVTLVPGGPEPFRLDPETRA